MRQQRWTVLALAAALSACATLEAAFAPAPHPWPIPRSGRARRDGRLLRVYGASLNNRAEAEEDARHELEGWLWRLELGDDLADRKALIESVLASPAAKPIPSQVPEASGYSSLIELDLPTLQKKLGTHYD